MDNSELVKMMARRAVEDFIRDNDEVQRLAFGVAEDVLSRIKDVCKEQVNALNIPDEIRQVASSVIPPMARQHLVSYEAVLLSKVQHAIATSVQPEFKRQSSKRRAVKRQVDELQKFIMSSNKGVAEFNDELIRELGDMKVAMVVLTDRISTLEMPWYKRLWNRLNLTRRDDADFVEPAIV